MKKEKTKASLGRVLPLVLCLCLVLSMLPGMGTRVFAAGAGKAVGNGTTALSINVNTSGAQVVYYGGRPYYVIGYGASGVQTADSSDITATLLAKNNFELTRFNPGGKNQYSGSLLQSKVDDIAAALSQLERASIQTRTLEVGAYSGDGSCDGVAGTAVENAYLWPLSPKEANAVDKQLRIVDRDHQSWATSYWWLRSPGKDDYYAASVFGNGQVWGDGHTVTNDEFGVRPAFNLNLNAVLFTSAAVGGKPDGLQEIQDYSGNAWKLTLKDSSRDRFTIGYVQRTGNSVTVYYSGAKEGSNEYISLLIADSTGTYTHYGRLDKASTAGGASVTFTLPELAEGSKVYIFNEQCNDDYQTDYAGDLVELAIPGDGCQDCEDGREVELRNNGTHIQWRYVGEDDSAWRDLVALDAITGGSGADGADGREVELRVNGGYIQWRYTTGSDTAWKNLMSLSDLKGQAGADGREVELKNDGTSILWRYAGEGDEAWRPLVALEDITGADGKQVELRVEGGYIQWRYTGGQWQNLIALSALQGMKGDKGDPGDTPYIGSNGNWWIGDTDTGIPATGDKGEDGLTPYIGSNGNWWIGDTDTGIPATGDKGEDGLTPYIGSNGNWWIGETDTGIPATGDKGQDGQAGADGLTPYIGTNGNWWISSTDTGIRAAGQNGKDGADGKDGQDGKDGADGKDGLDGIGIADLVINENGELVVTLTDATVKNLGKVTGSDGVGIAKMEINSQGELLITLTDGTQLNAGAVPTADAEQTETEDTQQNSVQPTILYVFMGISGISFAGMIGMFLFLLKKIKAR